MYLCTSVLKKKWLVAVYMFLTANFGYFNRLKMIFRKEHEIE